MDIKKYLHENFFLFSELNDADFTSLVKDENFKLEFFNSGDVLHNNKNSQKIGLLTKGKAAIRSGEEGVIIRRLSPNDIFGVASLFDSPSYFTSVIALSDVEMITLSKEFIVKCLNTFPNLSLRYITFLSKKISFLNTKINAYTAKSAENKLYTYLLQLPRNKDSVILSINVATLAKMLGVGRVTIYRSFDKLISQGLIIKNGKNIILKEV